MKTRGGLRAKKTCHDHSKSLPTNILTNATDSIKLQQKKNPVWTIEKLATNYVPNEIVGRDKEKAVIAEFVQNCVMNRISSKVLYISGIPGIGKTASTMEIVRQQEKQFGRNFRVSFINALTLKKQEDIYKLIWSFLTKEAQNQSNIAVKHLCSRIEQKIAKIKTNHLIVIDEVDFLVTKDQKIFYNLFEWASSVTSKLSLILIANTMDFPQKLSGKVTSRMGNNRLVFTPYAYQQIQQIINQRLIGCKYFAANALVYVSKKISSFNGDMRTVLEVLRQAVITHEQNGKLGKISIESVQKIWDLKTTDKENNLPQRTIRDEIIDLLKKRNGESTSLELQQILGQHGITTTGLLTLLKQMEEQGILIIKKAMKGLFQCYRVKLVNCLDP